MNKSIDLGTTRVQQKDSGSAVSQTVQHRLFFDISSLLDYVKHNDCYSGIQRVVAMVLIELAPQVAPDRLFISFVSDEDGQHYCVRLDEFGIESFLAPVKLRSVLLIDDMTPEARRQFRGTLRNVRDEIVGILRGRPIPQYPIILLRRLGRFISELVGLRRPKDDEKASRPHITMRRLDKVAAAGDRMVLLDSSWSKRCSDAYVKAHTNGLEFYTLIHDLIPVVVPELTSGDLPKVFYNWLKTSIGYTDTYIAISQSTRNDLERFLQTHEWEGQIRKLPLAQTSLGPELRETNRATCVPQEAVDTYLSRSLEIAECDDQMKLAVQGSYVLCVGTIEMRKNTWRLAMAWKSLLDQGRFDIPRLVIAGRKGCMSTLSDSVLTGTGNLYGYASVIEGPSDADLDFLYRNCLFAAKPSLYEGWGLPVGEALSYGKTVVVANNSSMPEVGLDMVEYCDPMSVDSIAAAVLRLVDDPDHRRALETRISRTRLRNWTDVATDLLQIVDAPASEGAAPVTRAGNATATTTP